MSRKWERMVERNSKKINKDRQKKGAAPVSASDGSVRIVGRSWVFPLVLASAGLLFGLTVPPEGSSGILYQVTVGLYILLALFHFFVRRPYIKINKQQLSWRTYTGEKRAAPGDVAYLQISDKRSVIALKDGKTRRTFSRLYHLYPMGQLNHALRQFADAHRVPVIAENKG